MPKQIEICPALRSKTSNEMMKVVGQTCYKVVILDILIMKLKLQLDREEYNTD